MNRGGVVAVVALMSAAVPARADDKKDAEALFRAGQQAFELGKYQDAADAFELAYAKLPLPAIGFSAAQAYRLQYFLTKQPRHLERAVALYHQYVDQQRTGGRIADAASNLAQLEPLLRELQASGASAAAAPVRTTRLMVMADVDGAQATIDGQGGAMPLVAEVTAGEHAIAVTAAGYQPVTIKAKAIDGETVPVDVQLTPLPAHLDVHAPAGARVELDGRPLGVAPIVGAEVAGGKHLVTITGRGRVPMAREIEVAFGQTAVIDAPLATTAQRRAARWVLIGGGALAIGAGIAGGLAWSSDSKANDLETRRTTTGLTLAELDRYDHLRSQRDDRVTATWLVGGAAAATLGAGVLLYLFDQRSPDAAATVRADHAPRRIDIEPVVAPGGAGVSIGGHF
jgi:hypothetical protein